jgi:predicted aspartyl protease
MHARRFLARCFLLFFLLVLPLSTYGLEEAAAQGVATVVSGDAAAAPHAEVPHAEVPLTFDDSTYAVVPVTIGGKVGLPFVLDTAAGRSVLTPWARDTLGLTEGDTVTVTGASGQATYPTLRLDSLQIGGQVVRDLAGLPVVDLSRLKQSDIRYAGILGNDVLRRFDVVYDLPDRRLRLYPIGSDSTTSVPGLDALQRLPFGPVPVYEGSGFVKFPLAVGTGTAEAVLDTGAPQSIFNWRAAALDGLTKETARRRAEGTRGLTFREQTDTYLYTFENVQAGPVRLAPREVRVADLPVFQRLRLADRPAIILGNDLLADRRVVIAYSTNTLHISAPR